MIFLLKQNMGAIAKYTGRKTYICRWMNEHCLRLKDYLRFEDGHVAMYPLVKYYLNFWKSLKEIEGLTFLDYRYDKIGWENYESILIESALPRGCSLREYIEDIGVNTSKYITSTDEMTVLNLEALTELERNLDQMLKAIPHSDAEAESDLKIQCILDGQEKHVCDKYRTWYNLSHEQKNLAVYVKSEMEDLICTEELPSPACKKIQSSVMGRTDHVQCYADFSMGEECFEIHCSNYLRENQLQLTWVDTWSKSLYAIYDWYVY
jgi:hypothetical protein